MQSEDTSENHGSKAKGLPCRPTFHLYIIGVPKHSLGVLNTPSTCKESPWPTFLNNVVFAAAPRQLELFIKLLKSQHHKGKEPSITSINSAFTWCYCAIRRKRQKLTTSTRRRTNDVSPNTRTALGDVTFHILVVLKMNN